MTAALRVPLPDLAATTALAARIAAGLQPGDVVALSGSLGAGKTTLARAIIAALGHEGEVPSPSFAIIELYETARLRLVHADFYRLRDRGEAAEIGLDDYRDGAALIAEWPEKAADFTDEVGCLAISLEILPESAGGGRQAIVKAGQEWLMRGPWTGP